MSQIFSVEKDTAWDLLFVCFLLKTNENTYPSTCGYGYYYSLKYLVSCKLITHAKDKENTVLSREFHAIILGTISMLSKRV